MDWEKPFDRLVLDDDGFVYDHVDAVSIGDGSTLVRHGQLDLPLVAETAAVEFPAETVIVDRLE